MAAVAQLQAARAPYSILDEPSVQPPWGTEAAFILRAGKRFFGPFST